GQHTHLRARFRASAVEPALDRDDDGKESSGRDRTNPGAAGRSMVPKRGLEPPRVSPLPPQGSASTNSATWAYAYFPSFPSSFGLAGAGLSASAAGLSVGVAAGLSPEAAGTVACGTSPDAGVAGFSAFGATPAMTPRSSDGVGLVPGRPR